MKRFLCLFLAGLLLFSLSACDREQPKLQSPVNFYYLRLEPTYGTADSLIFPVQTEGSGYAGKPEVLLQRYLNEHRESEEYVSPFPSGIKLLSLSVSNGVADLQLDKSFSQLVGLDLTLACACLTLTTMDLTGVDSVRITAKNATLDGASYVLMDRASLTLLDLYQPETT